jgi:aspartyl-tRNA synthetase
MLLRILINRSKYSLSRINSLIKIDSPHQNFSTSNLIFQNNIKNESNNSVKHAKFDAYRSHYCGNLNLENEGQHVFLTGWVQTRRGTNFLLLRDLHGIVQVYFNDEFLKNSLNSYLIKKLNDESVIAVRGLVRRRPKGQENPKMSTGTIEILCNEIELLNSSKTQLPFTISDFNKPNETIRLKYRYLDLRFREMQQNLIMRSNFVHKVRDFMRQNGFLDIETPTLFRRTPGGSREFIVPTKDSGQFYCLTQSPQQFKQLLMISGLDKYYQVARCYRDEGTKPDRQPEFTQIDIEMSFVNEKDIMNLIENLLDKCWPLEDQNQKPKLPIHRMKFEEAIGSYGVDKPDLRFDMKLNNLSNLIKNRSLTGVSRIDSHLNHEKLNFIAMKIPKNYHQNSLLTLNEVEKIYKEIFSGINFLNQEDKGKFTFLLLKNDQEGNNIAKYLDKNLRQDIFNELSYEKDDFVVLLASTNRMKSLEIMGKLRLDLADSIDKKVNNNDKNTNLTLLRDPKLFKFLWVIDFPLFTVNDETGQLESSHHPFTAPIPEHLEWVKEKKNLESVIGLHYDLVMNGCEIAGGSIRVHNADLQKHILKNILNESTDQLNHLIEALEYGAPPHGGIAIGLDRFVALMCGEPNIRNVIAFPKAPSGKDLMGSAPNSVSQEELDYYKIKPVNV